MSTFDHILLALAYLAQGRILLSSKLSTYLHQLQHSALKISGG